MAIIDLARAQLVGSTSGQTVDLSGTPVAGAVANSPVNLSAPQGGLPLLVGDQLILNAFSNTSGVTVIATGRYVSSQGVSTSFTQEWVYKTAYTPQQFSMPLPNGALQCVTLSWSGPTGGGVWVYATAGVINTGAAQPAAYLQLVGDYLTKLGTTSWPSRPIRHPLEGPGLSQTVAGVVDGGAGTVTWSVPVGTRWEIAWFNFSVTIGSAGARQFQAALNLGGATATWQGWSGSESSISTSIIAEWDAWGEELQNSSLVLRGGLPRPFYAHGGDTIVVTENPNPGGDTFVSGYMGMIEQYMPDQTT